MQMTDHAVSWLDRKEGETERTEKRHTVGNAIGRINDSFPVTKRRAKRLCGKGEM